MIAIINDDNNDDDDDDQAKPCIKPSKKQLRRHLSSAELTNTARAERDYDQTDRHSQQGAQRPQSLDRSGMSYSLILFSSLYFRWAGHQGQVYSEHYHEPDSVWHEGYDYGYEDHHPPPPPDPYLHHRDQYRPRTRDYRDVSPSMPGYLQTHQTEG